MSEHQEIIELVLDAADSMASVDGQMAIWLGDERTDAAVELTARGLLFRVPGDEGEVRVLVPAAALDRIAEALAGGDDEPLAGISRQVGALAEALAALRSDLMERKAAAEAAAELASEAAEDAAQAEAAARSLPEMRAAAERVARRLCGVVAHLNAYEAEVARGGETVAWLGRDDADSPIHCCLADGSEVPTGEDGEAPAAKEAAHPSPEGGGDDPAAPALAAEAEVSRAREALAEARAALKRAEGLRDLARLGHSVSMVEALARRLGLDIIAGERPGRALLVCPRTGERVGSTSIERDSIEVVVGDALSFQAFTFYSTPDGPDSRFLLKGERRGPAGREHWAKLEAAVQAALSRAPATA